MAYTTINKSGDYFNTKLYTGNGSAGHAITGVGFAPDWTWIKNRPDAAHHTVFDRVRGATKAIYTNQTDAETTVSGHITAFGSDGFTLGDNSGKGSTNENSKNYASWNWKAGGSGSSNTDGSITSTVSANTTAGFSIIKWTGTGSNGTIGHGLGAVPKVYIVKNLDSVGKFWFFPTFFNNANEYLDGFTSTAGLQTDGNGLTNSTLPTNSVISLGTSSTINTSGNDIICYAFAEKTGYSKFGSYIGNGSSSSPTFIYTGFKPKFVIVKNTSQADGWFMHDDKRDGYNDDNEYLFANSNAAEGSNVNRLSMYSNGFNVPTTDKSHNVNGNSYIYMAFGQSLVGSNNVPCIAR